LLMKTQWLCGDGRPSVFVCSICWWKGVV
jgi:hypothetical protein